MMHDGSTPGPSQKKRSRFWVKYLVAAIIGGMAMAATELATDALVPKNEMKPAEAAAVFGRYAEGAAHLLGLARAADVDFKNIEGSMSDGFVKQGEARAIVRGKALVLEDSDGRLRVSDYNKDLRDQLAAKTLDEVETVLVVTPVKKKDLVLSKGREIGSAEIYEATMGSVEYRSIVAIDARRKAVMGRTLVVPGLPNQFFRDSTLAPSAPSLPLFRLEREGEPLPALVGAEEVVKVVFVAGFILLIVIDIVRWRLRVRRARRKAAVAS